ncbi:MAG: GldG family protein [Acidobacteriota bacterium]
MSAPPSRRRPWVIGSTLGVGALLVLLIWAMVNYLAWRHHQRFDWTGAELYTLSEKSKRVVAELDRDIDLVTVIDPGSELFTQVDELLDRYVAANPSRVSRRDLDAARDRLELEQMVERYGIERRNVLVVASGDDRRIIQEFELAEYAYDGMPGQAPSVAEFRGEKMITGAILALVEARKPRILITTGHGELTLEPTADGAGLSQLRDLVGGDNFEIESWSSIAAESVPAGTDLVLVAGPRRPFLPSEVAMFQRYVAEGGRMLLLLDPALDGQATGVVDLGLSSWLVQLGIELRPDLVLDPTSAMPFYGPEALYTASYGQHPIVEGLESGQLPVLLPIARSVTRTAPAPDGVELDELVFTSDAGWGETDLASLDGVAPGGEDLLGPVPLAVAATVTARVAEEPAAPKLGSSELEQVDSVGGSAVDAAAEAVSEATGSGLVADEPAAPTVDADTVADPAADLAADAAADPVPVFEPDVEPAVSDPDAAGRLVVIGDSDFASDAQLANGANGILLLNAFNWLVEREQLLDIEGRKPNSTRLELPPGEMWSLVLVVLLLMPGLAVAFGIWTTLRRRR